jgi:DNA-binding IclR family transcriptional regulator
MQNKQSKSPARQAAAAKVVARPKHAKEDRHFVTALARGLQVLGAFKPNDRMLGNQELARRCNLPKSTISRLTHTLTREGYLEPTSDGKGANGYRLGSAVLAMGGAMLARLDMRKLARPLMQDLADRTQAMVTLGIRDRLSMIYVENCRSDSALTLSLDVGSRVPIAVSAMGRAYLAACGDSERSDVMTLIRSRDEKAWPKLRAGIERALVQYREQGCCSSFGDWQKDVNAIAMAFRPEGARALMVISCGGPGVNLSQKFLMTEARPKLRELVRKLEEASGDTAWMDAAAA